MQQTLDGNDGIIIDSLQKTGENFRSGENENDSHIIFAICTLIYFDHYLFSYTNIFHYFFRTIFKVFH